LPPTPPPPPLLLPLPLPPPAPPTLPLREFYKHHAKLVQNNVLDVVQLPYVQPVLLDIL
jgi:hypothetical protein